MLKVWRKREVRTALEKRQYGVYQKEYDEYVVDVEPSLLLVLLRSVKVIELVAD